MFIDEQDQENQPETNNDEGDDSQDESTDPLDTLDAEALRAEAKKFRSIAQRKAEKKETREPEVHDVVKKSDFERANEAQARRQLEQDSRPEAKEILENWSSVAELYGKVARRGKNTKEDIIDDLLDAHAVWSRSKPAPTADTKTPAADVAAMTGLGGKAPDAAEPKKERIIKPTKNMDAWYS